MGGRHSSDRLCSDRRYSGNPQSGWPCTSLARLSICRNSRNWEKIGGDWGVACIESTSLIQAPRGVGSGDWGGYSSEVWGAPYSGKVTTYLQGSNTVVLPPTPDFRDLVRRISNRYYPQAIFNCRHPTSTSWLWIVGTESVGIAWCTQIICMSMFALRYSEGLVGLFYYIKINLRRKSRAQYGVLMFAE